MKKVYLIDYENVKKNGLNGIENIGKEDRVVIFFSENAKDLDMRMLSNHGCFGIEFEQVPSGKQSLDMCIALYIGVLVENEKDFEVIIVSMDNDYDGLITYCKNKTGISASKIGQINEKDESQLGQTITQKSSENVSVKTNVNPNTLLNEKVMHALKNAQYSGDVMNTVASIVVKNRDKENYKHVTYLSIISKYGREKGLEIYNCVKKNVW